MASSASGLTRTPSDSQALSTFGVGAADRAQPSPFVGLGAELLIKILANLGPEEVERCRQVCRYWKVVGSDNELWTIFIRKLPGNTDLAIERLFPGTLHSSRQRYIMFYSKFMEVAKAVIPARSCNFVRGWQVVDMNGLADVLIQIRSERQEIDPISEAFVRSNVMTYMLGMIQEAVKTISSHDELHDQSQHMVQVAESVAMPPEAFFARMALQMVQQRGLDEEAMHEAIHQIQMKQEVQLGNEALQRGNGTEVLPETRHLASEIVIPYRAPGRAIRHYQLISYQYAPLLTSPIPESEDNPYYSIFNEETIRILRDPKSSPFERIQAVKTSILELQVPGMPEISTWTEEEKFSTRLLQILLIEVNKCSGYGQLLPLIPFIELLLIFAGETSSPMTGLQALIGLGPRTISSSLPRDFAHTYSDMGLINNALYAMLDLQTNWNPDGIRFQAEVLRLLLQYGANPNQLLHRVNGRREPYLVDSPLRYAKRLAREISEALSNILTQHGATLPQSPAQAG